MSHISINPLMTLTAAGVGTTTSSDYSVGSGVGVMLYVNITTITGTSPTLTVTLQGISPQGVVYTILASAALNSAAQTVLRVYPGLTAAANLVASDVLPAKWNVKAVIGGTTPAVTATISAVVID